MLNLRKQASETMNDVSEASKKITDTTEWAAVAIFAALGIAVVALAVAIVALERSGHE